MPICSASGKAYVIVVSLITAACLFGDSMLYIVLPVHYQDAGLSSLWEVGIILSMNRLIRLPLNPLVGRLYRVISIRGGILLATLLAAVSTLGYALAESLAVWLLLRAVWGLSWTLLRIGGFFCILDVSDNSTRGYYMGLYNGLYRIGSLVGMLLGGILADFMGFSATAALFGSGTALSMFAALTLSGGRAGAGLPEDGGNSLPRARTRAEGIVLLVLVTGAVEALAYQGLYAATLTRMISRHLGDVIMFGGLVLGAATLGGAVMGDHCSPISDTTIMASSGAQCYHLNHVATQLPYAMTVAVVCFANYILASFIQNVVINLAIAIVCMVVVLLVIGKLNHSMNRHSQRD